jgi:hypothetical protein
MIKFSIKHGWTYFVFNSQVFRIGTTGSKNFIRKKQSPCECFETSKYIDCGHYTFTIK